MLHIREEHAAPLYPLHGFSELLWYSDCCASEWAHGDPVKIEMCLT